MLFMPRGARNSLRAAGYVGATKIGFKGRSAAKALKTSGELAACRKRRAALRGISLTWKAKNPMYTAEAISASCFRDRATRLSLHNKKQESGAPSREQIPSKACRSRAAPPEKKEIGHRLSGWPQRPSSMKFPAPWDADEFLIASQRRSGAACGFRWRGISGSL
jgi:hypothetical protein